MIRPKTKSLKKRLGKEKKLRHLEEEDEEIKSLEKRIAQDAPPKGTNPLALAENAKKPDQDKKEEDEDYDVYYPAARLFSELPISTKTIRGLENAKFTAMTDIQRAALPHALCGRDILGAAKTGSGKTLAFLIPVLERLYRAKWSIEDSVGAIIVTPTRELALQIFEVLRTIGTPHALSAGLIIGGKDLKHEQERIERMNILVGTPGRLLQHMDETIGFNCSNLQVLVLDEADRILDMGFEKSVNAIVENLPLERQTLLFSATQTKSVKDLARLSLKDPEYISVHEKSEFSTPQKLVQHVVFVPLNEKLDTLWSFIKSHLKQKSIIFFSSCKQVRFIYECLRKLRPGVPLMAIHGKVKQGKRMSIFFDFCKKKEAVLFATDIAARGLDFPAVDWVVQADCPEDVATYIHRVGRTARYESGGCSLLLLLPSEKAMIPLLESKKIPVKVIKVNPKEKKSPLQPQLESLIAEDPELKYLAQKSFISYMRSIWLQSNKEVFNVHELPTAEYARSMGLSGTPKIKFAQTSKKDKNFVKQGIERKLAKEEEEEEKKNKKANQPVSKVEKMMKRKNMTTLSDTYSKLRENEESDEDDMLVMKRRNHDLEVNEGELMLEVPRKKKTTKEEKPKPKLTKFESDEEEEADEDDEEVSEEESEEEEEDDDEEEEEEEQKSKTKKRRF